MEGGTGSDREAYGKEDPHPLLCGRLFSRSRATSVRQLPTDHDYAVTIREYQVDQPSQKHLDRYPLCLPNRATTNWSFD